MKRLLTLILAILYMGSSTGATFHMHYCMGKLVEVNLWHEDDKKCGNCGTEQSSVCSKKCCKDEHKTVKLENDQKATENDINLLQVAAIAAPFPFNDLPGVYTVSLVEKFPTSNAPPRSSKIHTHILNCTFRI